MSKIKAARIGITSRSTDVNVSLVAHKTGTKNANGIVRVCSVVLYACSQAQARFEMPSGRSWFTDYHGNSDWTTHININ